MGYPIFGKVKTITLPLPAVNMSIEEYKNHYGIDLKPYIELMEDGNFWFVCDGYIILDVKDSDINFNHKLTTIRYQNVLSFEYNEYIEGVQDGQTYLRGLVYSLLLQLPKNAPFTLDNIEVIGAES